MGVALKAKTGPLKNQIFPVHPGFKIGRTKGDLQIRDSKVSSSHAYVDAKDDGTLILVDQRSKNGLKVQGVKKDIVPLVAGTEIQIGEEIFEVISLGAPASAAEPKASATEAPAGASPRPKAPPEPKARPWNDIIARFGRKNLPKIENQFRGIAPLQPALVLDFIRGPQIDTRWVLGFGPRRAGARSLDLPIFERNAPADCFEIFPSPDGISFRTKHNDVVSLNGRSVTTEILRVGDIIKIYGTEIEVDFIE